MSWNPDAPVWMHRFRRCDASDTAERKEP